MTYIYIYIYIYIMLPDHNTYIMIKGGTMHSTCHFSTIFFHRSSRWQKYLFNRHYLLLLETNTVMHALHLAVPTKHKCYRCGACLQAICSAIELDDPIYALDNDSVCHDCYRMMTQIQLLISSSQITWVSFSFLYLLKVFICYY